MLFAVKGGQARSYLAKLPGTFLQEGKFPKKHFLLPAHLFILFSAKYEEMMAYKGLALQQQALRLTISSSTLGRELGRSLDPW